MGECGKLNNGFQQRLAVDSVYRGAYDNPDGSTYDRQIHFDPSWLGIRAGVSRPPTVTNGWTRMS